MILFSFPFDLNIDFYSASLLRILLGSKPLPLSYLLLLTKFTKIVDFYFLCEAAFKLSIDDFSLAGKQTKRFLFDYEPEDCFPDYFFP